MAIHPVSGFLNSWGTAPCSIMISIDMLNSYYDFAAGMSVFKISKGLGGLA